MPNQRWAPVPGWPGYEAGSRGKIRSVERQLGDGRTAGGVILIAAPDADGYLFVTLSDGRRRRRVHVARLVLEAFDGPAPAGHEALHKNGRRRDDRYANLRWGTRPENRADRERHRLEREAPAAGAGAHGTGETDGTACCPLTIVAAGSRNGRSEP